MNQLQVTFTQDNNVFTQLKRSDKAALYKRETMEGAFVGHEVFAIMTKDGSEIYPQKQAFGQWAWTPMALERAEVYFNRLDKGEVVIPQVDPVTGEQIRPENEPTLEEALSETEPVLKDTTKETPVSVDVDPTAPAVVVETPKVKTPKTKKDKVVKVKTPKTIKVKTPKVKDELVIPDGTFDQATFAAANGLPARGIVWSKLDGLVQGGKLSKAFVEGGKGRPKAVFTKVAVVVVAPATVVPVEVSMVEVSTETAPVVTEVTPVTPETVPATV
jgi:hypothetical protein